MAAKEPYDYLPTKVADKNQTLTLSPQTIFSEIAKKQIVIHKSVDGNSETRLNFSGTGVLVWFLIRFDYLEEADAGTVMQFWYDEDYGNGLTYTFYLSGFDSHTYVVRFDCDFERAVTPASNYAVPLVRLLALGKVVD